MNTSEKIKFLRIEVIQMTQETLAKKLGVGVSSIKKWEGGICQTSVEHLEMLSFICGVSLNYLLFDNAPEELSLLGIDDEEYKLLNDTNNYFDKINEKKGYKK